MAVTNYLLTGMILQVGGGFNLCFSPLFREDFQFDEHICQMGWFNHQKNIYPKNIYNPMTWGWDLDHQSYEFGEGSGFLGKDIPVKLVDTCEYLP